MQKFQSVRGMHDILPEEIPQWREVEETFRRVCARANFSEIRTPVLEHTDLFARASGESSDVVVTKQMYSFDGLDGDSYTLRPEGTASVVRSFLQHSLGERGPVTKLFYIFPIFRYEAPGAGRYRQHHQCGIELLGASGPSADAEVLALARDFLNELGVFPTLKLNTLGTRESRRAYVEALRAHLEPNRERLSEDSKRRFELNPLRIFDSKEPRDHEALVGAPRLLDHVREHDAESSKHFDELCGFLDELEIPFEIDHNLVRGFDYYSRTAFEWVSDKLGAQSTVLGGGRYDGLVEELGGKPTPGIGFGCGIERLLLVRAASEAPPIEAERLTAFVVALGNAAKAAAPRLVRAVRQSGLSCDYDLATRAFRKQMDEANRSKARFALIVGDDELAQNAVALKDLDEGTQTMLSLTEACQLMKK
ncbi:histidine--tRNA ligase [Abditibacteriota bacterium]|nr:histidine--tRNA ligase [Abditibacteriota bacterium]